MDTARGNLRRHQGRNVSHVLRRRWLRLSRINMQQLDLCNSCDHSLGTYKCPSRGCLLNEVMHGSCRIVISAALVYRRRYWVQVAEEIAQQQLRCRWSAHLYPVQCSQPLSDAPCPQLVNVEGAKTVDLGSSALAQHWCWGIGGRLVAPPRLLPR